MKGLNRMEAHESRMEARMARMGALLENMVNPNLASRMQDRH